MRREHVQRKTMRSSTSGTFHAFHMNGRWESNSRVEISWDFPHFACMEISFFSSVATSGPTADSTLKESVRFVCSSHAMAANVSTSASVELLRDMAGQLGPPPKRPRIADEGRLRWEFHLNFHKVMVKDTSAEVKEALKEEFKWLISEDFISFFKEMYKKIED